MVRKVEIKTPDRVVGVLRYTSAGVRRNGDIHLLQHGKVVVECARPGPLQRRPVRAESAANAAIADLPQRQHLTRGRPGERAELLEKCLRHRVCSRNELRGRDVILCDVGASYFQPLVATKEEQLVLDNWAAQHKAELVANKTVLRDPVRVVVVAVRREGRRPVELPRRAVELVGSALGDHVDHATRSTAILRAIVGRDHAVTPAPHPPARYWQR